MKAWGPSPLDWHRATLEILAREAPEWTEYDLELYLRDYKRMQASTIKKRTGQLRFMERHEERPVEIHGRLDRLVESFYWYVTHREHVELKAPTALGQDHAAIRCLGAMLGIPRDVWPTKPAFNRVAKDPTVSPEDVYNLIHYPYFDHRDPRSGLIKGMLAMDFLVGMRVPSELYTLKTSHHNPKQHTLRIKERKKGNSERLLFLEPTWICCSTRHPSLANYYTSSRDKVATRHSPDDIFLLPNGQPFASSEAMRRWLWKVVKPVFPWFYPYLGRHWCATARLIESYDPRTQSFDYVRVADWLGHDSVEVLRRYYDHSARLAMRIHGRDWLLRAVRSPTKRKSSAEGGAVERLCSDASSENGVSLHATPGNEERTRGDSPRSTGGICSDGWPIFGVLVRAHRPVPSLSAVQGAAAA